MPKAIIKTVKLGKKAGQFRFTLIGNNGQTICHSGTETYTRKHNVKKLLTKYFPAFDVVDETL